MFTEREGGDLIRCFEAVDDREESQYVIREILAKNRSEHRPYGDFAILYRQYDLVRNLIAAGEEGLDKDGMESECPSARNMLRGLMKKDPDWAEVIRMPGKTGGRYRIL